MSEGHSSAPSGPAKFREIAAFAQASPPGPVRARKYDILCTYIA
jgi:hypothetical protein